MPESTVESPMTKRAGTRELEGGGGRGGGMGKEEFGMVVKP